MFSETAVEVTDLSKCYQIYERPENRLKQFIIPKIEAILRRPPTKYYKEFWALRNVSFKVMKGETVGIIGKNGSGKSTLLQLICQTLHPTSGTVKTHGKVAALLELGSGFNNEYTGRENIYLNGSLHGLSRRQLDERFESIARFADINAFLDQPVKTYSSGMYVRLAFAIIAHVDADVLIIDEALAVGDVFFTQRCMQFLRDFQKRGSILFVTHDTSSVLALCNRAVWLDKGQNRATGEARKVCELYLDCFNEIEKNEFDEVFNQSAAHSPSAQKVIDFRDCRQDFLNHTNLRNDLEFFEFDASSQSKAQEGAVRIERAFFKDQNNLPVKWFVGGEIVELQIELATEVNLRSLIVGFLLKDRLGQPLFGDNTYLRYIDTPVFVPANHRATALFGFRMPVLPAGEYTVGIAIADGTQAQHKMHIWIHDAMVITSTSKNLATGLIGIPMQKIEISTDATKV